MRRTVRVWLIQEPKMLQSKVRGVSGALVLYTLFWKVKQTMTPTSSEADQKLHFSDQDLDPIWQVITDPDRDPTMRFDFGLQIVLGPELYPSFLS